MNFLDILQQAGWVILAVVALLYIITDGFAFFRAPKKKAVPVKGRPSGAGVKNIAGSTPNTANKQIAQSSQKTATTSSSNQARQGSKAASGKATTATAEAPAAVASAPAAATTIAADKKADPAGASVAKTSFESDRDVLKKSTEMWRRCSKREKSGKEMSCSTGRYCMNELIAGGCVSTEFRNTLFGLSEKKALDIFPYNELEYDEAIANLKWPCTDLYPGK